MHLLFREAKLPNLELITEHEQLIGYLLVSYRAPLLNTLETRQPDLYLWARPKPPYHQGAQRYGVATAEMYMVYILYFQLGESLYLSCKVK